MWIECTFGIEVDCGCAAPAERGMSVCFKLVPVVGGYGQLRM